MRPGPQSVVVSGSRLSRLPAQKGHPSTKRACLRNRSNNRHRRVNADWDRNVLGVEENIEHDIARARYHGRGRS
jgi:hypothetical protein